MTLEEKLNKLLLLAELDKNTEENIIKAFDSERRLGKIEIISMLETTLIKAGKLSEENDNLLAVFNRDVLGM